MHYIGIDHVVLTVCSIERSLLFYCKGLGLIEETFGEGRKAILCGKQKINLHEVGHEFSPRASKPTPGSADLCLITDTPIQKVQESLLEKNIAILQGPIEKAGAKGRLLSIYVRDPDQNLIEIANYLYP